MPSVGAIANSKNNTTQEEAKIKAAGSLMNQASTVGSTFRFTK